MKRTPKQNSGLWLYYDLKSQQLNDMGKDMRLVLKPHIKIPWTKQSFHDEIWIPIQKAMYGTDSTTELLKQEQIDSIHEVIERELGIAHHAEYIPFPSKYEVDQRQDAIKKHRENIKNLYANN
jgi:hypothetical protein